MKYSNFSKHFFTETILKNGIRRPSRFALPVALLRGSLNQMCRLFPVQRDVHIESTTLAGCNAEWIHPKNVRSEHVILHIHGGAFFLGGLNTHRAFVTDLAVYSGCSAIQLDYPLAPEHPFPAAIETIHTAYLTLLEQGLLAKNIVISGDSCGANLALVLCLLLKELGQPMPSGLMLLSPWLDLTLSSPSLRYNRKQDALLSINTLQAGIQHYVGKGLRCDHPQLSPILDDLSGLPPTLVQVGSKEILLDDAKRFQQQAKAAGIEVTLQIYTSMWHNFHMFQAWFDEAREALTDISCFVHELKD